MKHRDNTVYRGRFSGLHLKIFGLDQVLAGEFDVQVMQHRANPPLWVAAPTARGKALWRGGTPEIVMKRVLGDFDRVLDPFFAVTATVRTPPRLSPAPQRSAPDEKAGRPNGCIYTAPRPPCVIARTNPRRDAADERRIEWQST